MSKAGTAREEAWYLLEVAAITGFLISQPVLDIFGRSPETFISRGADRSQVIAFAIAVAAVPALAVWAITFAARLAGRSRRRITHVAALGVLAGLLAARLGYDALGSARVAAAALGVIASICMVMLYARTTWARTYLRVASAAPLAFATIFLVASPTADLVLGGTVKAADVEVPDAAPSILFIVLDQFPTASLLDGEGHIDADLFPSFARLAETSTWYRNNTTVAPWTNLAVPAIVTGTLPVADDTAATASNFPRSIFTLLGGSYDLNVSEPVERICPATLCGSGPGDGLGALFGDAVGVAGNVADAEGEGSSLVARGTTWDERADDFEEFSASIAPGRDRPVLDYMHSLLPHDPVEYLPNGVKYPAPEHPVGLFLLTWTDEHGAAIGRQRHLLQAQLTDRLLGEALDRLEDAGRFDNTLIVVTADHGVGFTNLEPWRGTSAANYEQIMWTPLLIKEPHQEQGRIDDKNAWSVDVLPTVAEILGVEIPADWEITGHSLIGDGEVRDPSDKVLFTQLGNSLPAAADGLVHVDGVEGFERLLKWSSAPPGDDDLRVWRQGEYGALVGTRPEEHTIGQPAGFDGWLADPDVYDDVDPNHDPPIHLDTASVGTEPGPVIAVAVNGVIGGWGPTFASTVEHVSNFWTLIPDSLLRDGRNELELYEISGPVGDVTLSPVPMRDP